MPLQIPPQPTLPTEEEYSEVELAFIEEQPDRFPINQNSNWGYLRKIFCDQLQLIVDDQETIWRNRFLDTADEYLEMWEEMLGLPINPPETAVQRIALVKGRLYKGPFTRTQRHEIVHGFIEATMGSAPQLTQEGLELTVDGIVLMADPVVDILDHHVIIENIENFSYTVGVDRALGIDLLGLTRELLRYTPSGISFTVTEDYYETLGATSAAAGGFVIDRTDL